MANGKPPRHWRAVVGWNVLLLSLGAALIFIDWEAWFHLRAPFTKMERRLPTRFEPGTGLLNEPGAEVRWTRYDDFWVAQRANRWGFLDREPLTPEQATRTCHIAFIGDSFVEAREVPVADKFHARLEELAARALPRLNISTSAYGRTATGQINQLPFYAKYARQLRPKLVVLVFVSNDFKDNHKLLAAIYKGWDPDKPPYVVAEKTASGAIALRPPDPAWQTWQILPNLMDAAPEEVSLASRWLRRATGRVPGAGLPLRPWRTRVELLAQRPRYQSVLEPYLSKVRDSGSALADKPRLDKLLRDPALPLFREAIEFTAFALDEFQRRVVADGGSLWILLSSPTLGNASHPLRVIVEDLAKARGILVVSQHDYLVRQGRKPKDGTFSDDGHWNPTGHQWAAEALLERLRERPEVCGASGA